MAILDELAFHRRGLCVSGSAHVTLSTGFSLLLMSPTKLFLILFPCLQTLGFLFCSLFKNQNADDKIFVCKFSINV